MVRAKGKAAAGASTKRSASNKDAAATATVASKAAPSTNDSSETTGGSVEAVVTEQTVTEQITITAAAEEENDGAEPETLDEELDTEEDDDNDAELETLDGEQMVEENDGVDPETLNEEYTMEEDEENEVAEGEDEENEVVEGEDEENEMVDGDEKDGADEKEEDAPQKKKEEDAIGSGEANNQETAMEQEGSKQQIDDKQVEAAAGTVKDKQENTEDKTSVEAAEGSGKAKAKRMRKKNKWNNKRRKVEPMKGENKQGMDKVASNGKVGKDSSNLDSKIDNEQSSKKVASVAAQDMDTKGKDKPEPSQKKSTPKKKKKEKANGMGMIFMCNSETKKDCYRYKVLGLPASKKEMVDKIYKGMRLFLYDVDLKLLYGIYKAVGRGGHNIEPKAFKSQYPSQVRFAILEDCLPLAEETFRKVIKKNYYTKAKFDCQLSPEQVRDLCKLFTSKSKGSRSKDARRAFDQTHVISKQDRTKRRRGRVEQRRPERAPRRAGRIEEPRRYPERIEEPHVLYHQLVDEPRGYRERVEERVYHEHPRLHERSLVISPVVPLAPPAVQSYAYRTLAYRRDDPYRQSQLVELPDAYRRDPVPDAYRRQAVVEPLDYHRREVLPPPVRREYHRPLNLESRLQDGVGITDPYVSYRERLSYQDSVVRSQPEYNPSAGLRAAYRHAGPSAEFSSTRGMLTEYPSSAAGSLYEYPRYR